MGSKSLKRKLGGIIDNGYGIYDHYDLGGNYYQRETTETRFGSRSELEQMIAAMHEGPKIEVYADVVLNHIYSNDTNEEVNPAVKAYVLEKRTKNNTSPIPPTKSAGLSPRRNARRLLYPNKRIRLTVELFRY